MQLETDEDLGRTNSLLALNYHPDFASTDGNVVLAAKDAKLYFRVHAFTLKTASGFFRTMFALPQHGNPPSDVVYLDEDAVVLAGLLRMLCGLSFPEIPSLEMLQSLLFAAEKYDMPGPMSLMRMYLLTQSLGLDPIRLYALARRYEWDHESKVLSSDTLALNLFDEKHHPSLRTLSTEALLDLIVLHRSRRDGLQKCLNEAPFVTGDPSTCIQCHALITNETWRELKHRIVAEMDERPLGDTVLDLGLSTWPEAIACWRAACRTETCKRLLYDKTETIRVVKECIEGLPKTV
ncbi:hypothetical protein NLJ89_g3924 [Agrocybe chaxingu]|uniref:BTB domain-containing protein n=1 Tax=Agrocybe chaxingu TaxID=84603 RepID=A0A9W8MV14_9AGAR|nr:hypothetical protein NLJ89_g3924 [Agrocybe chaxingu]